MSGDSALILFDLLAKINNRELVLALESQAQRIVLAGIESDLESALTEPLMPNYNDLVSEAADRVEAKGF